MSERLRPRDVALLAEESPSTPMHNATLEIFDCGDPGPDGRSTGSAVVFDHAAVVRLVQERISFVPRYRQRVQQVPGRLANPVWVDDEHFDIGYHVRRSALPRPGTLEQLRELTARIVSRPLDRSRPLWEVYVIEGLAGGQVALLSKAHQVLVDGIETVDLGQVLLDASPEPKVLGPDVWQARRRPSPLTLLTGAVRDSLTSTETVPATVRSTAEGALRRAAATARSAGRVADALTHGPPTAEAVLQSPFLGALSQQRRVITVETSLADHRRVRDAHGGTINDVVLATVAGTLRSWLMARGESMRGISRIRTIVPISVIDEDLEATSMGSQIAAHYVDLPVGEPSPVVRLHQVSYAFRAHQETGRAVGAHRLASLSGFAPATFHAIGSRLAARERRSYRLCVTNVPGPQTPLYAAGARMVASYPIPPLVERHPLAVGVTSYDGRVFYGLTADRDLVPDAEVLAACVREALDELLDAVSESRRRAPRGRSTRRRQEEPT